jgi:hypothetical protein
MPCRDGHEPEHDGDRVLAWFGIAALVELITGK